MPIGLIEAEQIKKGIMYLCENALDYMEVSILNKEHYDVIRRKILRKANDLCRHIDALVRNGNGKGE